MQLTAADPKAGLPHDEAVVGAKLGPLTTLPLDDVLAYARQIAEALDYAHERRVLHRDLKPGILAGANCSIWRRTRR